MSFCAEVEAEAASRSPFRRDIRLCSGMKAACRAIATLLLTSATIGPTVKAESGTRGVSLWDRFETVIVHSNHYDNPFQDVELKAMFTSPSGREVRFGGFYDGDGDGGQSGSTWRLRYMPDEVGRWEFRAFFSDGSPGAEGAFDCVAANAKPGPLRADGRSLHFADGRNFFPRSYYLSEAFSGATPYWEDRIRRFFGPTNPFNFCCTTFWQGPLLKQHRWNNLPDNGFYPIVHGDYTRLDVAAWKHVDAVLRELEARNTVWFNFDGFVPNVGGDMGATRTNFDAQRVYLRNTVARLAPYWNVIWNVAFEWQEFLSVRDVARIVDEVRWLDPWHHLITVHDQGSFRSGAELRRALHVDFPTLQYDAGKVPDAKTAWQLVRQFAGDWPVYANEVTWEAVTKLDADQVRRGAWGVALAGGIVNYAEMFEGPNQGTPANYGDGGAFPYLAILFDFLESLPSRKMQPQPGLAGPGVICAAKTGEQYVCYAPDGGEIRLDLSLIPQEFRVRWLNPRTGERVDDANVMGGARRSFKPPFDDEAVLILQAR